MDCFTSKKRGGRLLGSARLLRTIRYSTCMKSIYDTCMKSIYGTCMKSIMTPV